MTSLQDQAPTVQRPDAGLREVPQRPRGSRRLIMALLAALVIWLLIVASLARTLATSDASDRRSMTERTQQRVALGAEFARLYVRDILSREREQGQTWLAGPQISAGRFASTMGGLGLPAAVLLDSRGRLLQIVPTDSAMIGAPISRSYAHLAAAVAGAQAVSNVVPSAALGDPVVAFATPFETPYGRRVLSGAYDVSKTPLGAYLGHLTVTPGHQVYLVDAHDNVIASSRVLGLKQRTLAEADPRLAAAAGRRSNGTFGAPAGAEYFATAKVAGTPWRLLLSVPQAALFGSIDAGDWLDWVALAGLAGAGLVVLLLVGRLQVSRVSLAEVNRELDRLAHVDSLTGVMTRRAISQTLAHVLSAATRHSHAVSVLMIDVDHFKALNDTLGHQGGDRALEHTVGVISQTLRGEDVAGRWGGEEFLVVLPETDLQGAQVVAERVRMAIEDTPALIGGVARPLSVTIGVAEWSEETMEGLIARADAALYAGKAAGRNLVSLS